MQSIPVEYTRSTKAAEEAENALVEEIQRNEEAWRRQQEQAKLSPIFLAPLTTEERHEAA